ncbi:MAG TPA: helix-turn-helix transcriptional regulator [Candidatus Saccharimonadales bacterium]|jgi:transcriptional regulator with XRE-family HTH domain|nr:helix-turn-helix transcriptional regulator [Candidatus Saccharimonadales bacterium]
MRHPGKRQGTKAGGAKIAMATARRQRALGARVRELRKRRDWSQRGLADTCGLVPSQVGKIERGEGNVTLTTLLKVAAGFDTTLTQLFSGLG